MTNAQAALQAAALSKGPGKIYTDVLNLASVYKQWLDDQDHRDKQRKVVG